jgi:hypothetical protein
MDASNEWLKFTHKLIRAGAWLANASANPASEQRSISGKEAIGRDAGRQAVP